MLRLIWFPHNTLRPLFHRVSKGRFTPLAARFTIHECKSWWFGYLCTPEVSAASRGSAPVLVHENPNAFLVRTSLSIGERERS